MSEQDAPLVETPAAEPDLTTKIEAPPEPVVETPAETTTETEPETVDLTETPEDDGDDAKKRIPGSQRLKRRLELATSEALSIQRENEQLKQLLQQRTMPQNEQGQPGVDREPTEADFPDYFTLQEKRTAWAARQAVRDEFARIQSEQQKINSHRAQIERQREWSIAYEENKATVRERIPDFDRVIATSENVRTTDELTVALLSSKKPALLQYYLAKNPDRVRELNSLSGFELAHEVAGLAARLHLPTPKKATEASPPPTEVRGGAAQPFDPFTTNDMNAYAAWMKKRDAS